jgi:hypothetical protein
MPMMVAGAWRRLMASHKRWFPNTNVKLRQDDAIPPFSLAHNCVEIQCTNDDI